MLVEKFFNFFCVFYFGFGFILFGFLKKKIEFIPGNSLKNGSGFGINTHLGYVGAVANGEPIIFHNVHGDVYATPLSKMGDTKVLWVKTGPTGNVVNPEKTSPSWWESFVSMF